MFTWIRTHKYLSIGAAIVILILGGLVVRGRTAKKSNIVTATVDRRDLEQTVSVVGNVDVAQRVNLSAKHSGQIVRIPAPVGSAVKAGQGVVELESSDARLTLAQARAGLQKAQADLNVRIAGATPQSLSALAATTQQRSVELQKAHDDLVAAQNDQQLTITTQQQLVTDAKTNVTLAAQAGVSSVATALNDSDAILGVDVQTSNDAFRDDLAVKDPQSLNIAKDLYRTTKVAQAQASTAIASGSLDAMASATSAALQQAASLLSEVSHVLATSVTSSSFSQSDLDAKESGIATDRTSVNAAQSTLQTKQQALISAQLTQQNALNSAQSTVITKQNAIASAQAALESAKATEAQSRVPPRAVDIASLQALVAQAQVQVQQAQQAVDDTVVHAPIDGTISDIPVKVGEQIVSNQTLAVLLSSGGLEITANVTEVDIAKVQVGQTASMTLDAFGSQEKFSATVISINPAQTVVEGVATYKVTLHFTKDDPRIKPGMTANIDILTGESKQALVVPQRSVHVANGQAAVMVLLNPKKGNASGNISSVTVTTGLQGSDGYVEIRSGLQEGQTIVVSGL